MKTLILAALAATFLLATACGTSRTTRVEDGTTVMEVKAETKAEAEPKGKPRTAAENTPKGRSEEELEALGYDIGRTLYGKD